MKSTILLGAAMLTASTALAHGDHPPRVAMCKAKVCNEEEIKVAAPAAVKVAATKDKSGFDWKSAEIKEVKKQKFKVAEEFLLKLVDEKQKDEKLQKRYIFITLDGYFNGSNATGE